MERTLLQNKKKSEAIYLSSVVTNLIKENPKYKAATERVESIYRAYCNNGGSVYGKACALTAQECNAFNKVVEFWSKLIGYGAGSNLLQRLVRQRGLSQKARIL
ncbi:MAG: hypothetical protein IJL02_11630 [Methanobrevibacter sp.]|uniref:DUF6664 family protein n=1 Tax=Methanobrevibacter sp. TaxID=66852 RepID=UPI0025DE5C73|nr:hypothetical protein [Methanobrevibacter sp.]MBQ6100496.1 hypothetical protein [Methanobrevibacter sp.]